MQEIERKFLVNSEDFKVQATKSIRIVQAYLNSTPERTVRVRIKGDKAFLTIKGKGNERGTTRFEWEKEIPLTEAEQLLPLCEAGLIEKIRYEIPIENHVFEVDEFLGENSGLIVAEVELNHENESFETPTWLANEVTGDRKYYNSYISKNSFNTWAKN